MPLISLIRNNLIPALIIVALLAVGGLFAWNQWQALRGAKVENRIQQGQTGAAIESGGDAVQTIGNSQSREAAIEQTVRDGINEIEKAPAGDSNAVADRAACRLRAYRGSPRCVALLGAVAP